MLRFLLLTILLTKCVKFELKAEQAPSVGDKVLEKKSNEEQQLDQLKPTQENVWYKTASFHKTKKKPLETPEENGRILEKANGKNDYFSQTLRDPKIGSLHKFPGVQYTPQDLAEYIVRTGDEKGVASAIRNLLRSKLLNRHDALSFLEEVENFIPQVKLIPKTKENGKNSVQYFVKRRNEELLKQARKKKAQQSDRGGVTTETPLTTALLFVEAYPGGKDIKESNHILSNRSRSISHLSQKDLHNELVMRNVIYRLAKQMFWHSLASGENGAKRTLTRLITILEKDVHDKMVPQKVKEIIIESISAALIDSMKGYPRIFSQRNSMRYSSLSQRRNTVIRARTA